MGGTFGKLTVLWLLLNGLDLASTLVAFQHGLVELNPLPSWVLGRFGIAQFIAWKLFWVAWIPVVVYLLRRRYRLTAALRIGCVILSFVVIWNVAWIGQAIGTA